MRYTTQIGIVVVGQIVLLCDILGQPGATTQPELSPSEWAKIKEASVPASWLRVGASFSRSLKINYSLRGSEKDNPKVDPQSVRVSPCLPRAIYEQYSIRFLPPYPLELVKSEKQGDNKEYDECVRKYAGTALQVAWVPVNETAPKGEAVSKIMSGSVPVDERAFDSGRIYPRNISNNYILPIRNSLVWFKLLENDREMREGDKVIAKCRMETDGPPFDCEAIAVQRDGVLYVQAIVGIALAEVSQHAVEAAETLFILDKDVGTQKVQEYVFNAMKRVFSSATVGKRKRRCAQSADTPGC